MPSGDTLFQRAGRPTESNRPSLPSIYFLSFALTPVPSAPQRKIADRDGDWGGGLGVGGGEREREADCGDLPGSVGGPSHTASFDTARENPN